MGNMIYTLDSSNNDSLDTTPLSELMNKVIIIVDPTHGNKTAFPNSRLSDFASMITGVSMNNQIYRESTLLGVVAVNKTNGYATDVSNNLSILYPDLQANKNNYDFVTSGIFNYLSFIGMNFQYNDQFLIQYNTKFFNSCAFIKKQKMIETMCLNPEFGATNVCKNIIAKKISNDKFLNP
jgi:hypothetical protein